MSLNVKKFKLMTITCSKSPRPLYTIESDTLEIVNNYKYLGVTITSDLSWKQHINNIVSKTTKLFGFIRRIVKCRDPGTIVKLYCSLCRPILECASTVWCPCLITQQDTLERVQRRFTRSCLGLPRRASLNSVNEIDCFTRCAQLGLPLLINRLHFLSISFVGKCLYNSFDVNISNYIQINTRHTDTVKFHHQSSRTNAFHHSLFIRFPRIWDSLPVDVKDQIIVGYKPFLNALREHILTHGVSIALPK